MKGEIDVQSFGNSVFLALQCRLCGLTVACDGRGDNQRFLRHLMELDRFLLRYVVICSDIVNTISLLPSLNKSPYIEEELDGFAELCLAWAVGSGRPFWVKSREL